MSAGRYVPDMSKDPEAPYFCTVEFCEECDGKGFWEFHEGPRVVRGDSCERCSGEGRYPVELEGDEALEAIKEWEKSCEPK